MGMLARSLAVLLVVLGLGAGSAAQEGYRLDYESLLATQQLLLERIQMRQQTTDPLTLQKLDLEIAELDRRFAQFVSGMDTGAVAQPGGEPFDVQSQIVQLLQPLIRWLQDATAEPREIAALKDTIDRLDLRIPALEQALRNSEATVAQLAERGIGPEEGLRQRANEVAARWRRELDRARNERRVAQGRLLAREQAQRGLVDSVSTGVESFFRALFQERVLNVLLALFACGLTFFGIRILQQRLARRRLATGGALPGRVINVMLHVLAVLLAVVVTIAVFYARNDWLLLSVTLVFLVGLGWALVRTLPSFVEQVRLMLNIGPVREGERIVFDGLPYRVDSLRFYSRLDNPELAGGALRVPIRELIGMRSRRAADGEPWFPTRAHDWVLLADGTFGRVDLQTPEQVVVTTYVTQRTWTTKEFLALSPRNLSRGFHVEVTFGVDYALQKESTSTVPERMAAALREGLVRVVDASHLQHVFVELRRAGASALEYEAEAWFDGRAAAHYEEIQRAMARILVDVCTENGWVIPFQQVTLHRAR